MSSCRLETWSAHGERGAVDGGGAPPALHRGSDAARGARSGADVAGVAVLAAGALGLTVGAAGLAANRGGSREDDGSAGAEADGRRTARVMTETAKSAAASEKMWSARMVRG